MCYIIEELYMLLNETFFGKKQHASNNLYDLKTEYLYIDVSIILGMVVYGKTLIFI